MGIGGRKIDLLTIRQIVRLARSGLSHKAIAREMNVSSRTVLKYLSQRSVGEAPAGDEARTSVGEARAAAGDENDSAPAGAAAEDPAAIEAGPCSTSPACEGGVRP